MSQYIVSARKYRPTTFEDVIGQDHISKTLKNAIMSGKLAHSFLFCGPRGVGKTTCARILAKVINCENPKDKVEPCNTCISCTAFNENTSFSIFELDAASNNSVDNIRSLTEQVRILPQSSKYKIFIIDEVHMLSTSAFNAFLKTLEEPPSYAIFILATTEKHKILPTILSRCQIFDFKRIQPIDVVKQLELICKNEGRSADQEALHQIAVKADGAMRDALSIFDKVVSSGSGKNITYKDVIDNLNILDYDYFFQATDAMLKSDLKSLILILDEVIRNGFDSEQFIHGLSDHLRELLVSKDPKTIHLMECSDMVKKRYYNQSILAHESFLLSALNVLNQCDINLPRSYNKRLHTEIALSKLCYLPNVVETDILIQVANKRTASLPSKIVHNIQNNDYGTITIKPKASDLKPKIESQQAASNVTEFKSQTNNKDVEKPSIERQELKSNTNTIDDGVKAIPSLRKPDEIRRQLKKEEEEKRLLAIEFALENIETEWKKYTNATESKSVKAALQSAILELPSKNELKIYVQNQYNREIISQETGLISIIHKLFGGSGLTIDIRQDKDRFPEAEDKPVEKKMTAKETCEAMIGKNAKLKTFMEKLKLKIPDSSNF